MSSSETETILRRKLVPPPGPLEATGMSPAKALRLAMARAGEECIGLTLAVSGFAEDRLTLADLVATLENGTCLIFSLRGPDASQAIAVWDLASVSALIEHMVTGRVVPGEPAERMLSRIDAAMVSDFLDRCLNGFDAQMEGASAGAYPGGFRVHGVLEDARAVSMALEDMEYRQFRLSLDFAEGAKAGELRIAFPRCSATAAQASCESGSNWAGPWQVSVRACHAPVQAVLHRFDMPLSRLSALAVGETIPLPRSCLGAVSVEGHGGRRIVTGRLGQVQRHRAVRIMGQDVAEESPRLPQAEMIQPENTLTDTHADPGQPAPQGTGELAGLTPQPDEMTTEIQSAHMDEPAGQGAPVAASMG